MVKPIMRDVLFLGQKSIPATEEDLQMGRDLQDTLAANREYFYRDEKIDWENLK